MKAIKNARVFDGINDSLSEPSTIVIDNRHVKEIEPGEVSIDAFDDVIDAGGRVVMPGLTDCHVHIAMSEFGRDGARVDEKAIGGVVHGKQFLEAGFTTIRDAGGITYGLKRFIDAGLIDGPRIFPSNAFISQTSGHGDCRVSGAEYRVIDKIYASPSLMTGERAICDGVPEVLRAVRENFFLGASQIKLMAGGGVMSICDPIETVQFTYEEMKAAVDAAEDYGTYVLAHLYTPKAIKRAAKAGIKSFEHCQLMDDEAAKAIADVGGFIDPCPNMAKRPPDIIYNNPIRREKQAFCREGEIKQTELIKKYGLNLLFGTDSRSGDSEDIRHYKERFGSFETVKSATGAVNELIKLTTYQNPYPDGEIGVLKAGAFADILIVEGNPLEDANVLISKDNLKFIMKDGKVFKNTLLVD